MEVNNMENWENNNNVEDVKEEIQAIKIEVSDEKKRELNIEINSLKEQLENNKKDLLKFYEELEKVQKKIKVRENNMNYLENKIRTLILEREGLEVRF